MLLKQLYRQHHSEAVAIADQGVVSLTTFLTGIFLARYCLKEEYGLYYLAITQLPAWDNIRQGIISMPLTVFLPRKGVDLQPAYIGSSFILETGLMAIGTFLIAGASLIFRHLAQDPDLARVILISGLLAAGYLCRGYFRSLFYALLKNRLALIMDCMITFLQIGGILFLHLRNSLNAFNAILAVGLAQSVSLAFGLIVLSAAHQISLRGLDPLPVLRHNWKLGKWLIGKSIAFAASIDTLPWLLKWTHDSTAVAGLAASLAIVNILNPLWIGFTNSVSAKMAHAYTQNGLPGLRKMASRSQAVLFGSMGVLTILLCFLANRLLLLFYGDKYMEQGLVVIALSIVLFISVSTICFELALITLEKSSAVFQLYLKVLGLALLPSAILIYLWGLWGILIGFAVTWTCISYLRTRAYHRALKVQSP